MVAACATGSTTDATGSEEDAGGTHAGTPDARGATDGAGSGDAGNARVDATAGDGSGDEGDGGQDDDAGLVDAGELDAGDGGGAVAASGRSLVGGGTISKSANHVLVHSLSQAPGGNGAQTSRSYQLFGGLVGATQ